MRKLVPEFDFLVPVSDIIFARGKPTVGYALAILIPHIFKVDEFKAGGVRKLHPEKVAALVGKKSTLFG